MTLSPADASVALADIDAAQARSITLRGYQRAAPHLIIWGIAWAIGYMITDTRPAWGNIVWSCIGVLGATADIAAAHRDRADHGHGATVGLLFVIFLVLVGGTIAVMRPTDPRQVGAFIPLVVAAAYSILGVMGAPRLLALGGAIAALTLLGFFALPVHFGLWMAVVGGGGLVLGGIWMRRV